MSHAVTSESLPLRSAPLVRALRDVRTSANVMPTEQLHAQIARELGDGWTMEQTRSEYGCTWHLMLRAAPNLKVAGGG